jgi:hypothetical protein
MQAISAYSNSEPRDAKKFRAPRKVSLAAAQPILLSVAESRLL